MEDLPVYICLMRSGLWLYILLFFKFKICKYLNISFFNWVFFPMCLTSMKLLFLLQSPIPLGSFPAAKSRCWAWAITAPPCAAGVSCSWVGGQGLVSPELVAQSVPLPRLPWPKPWVYSSASSPVPVQLAAPVPRGLSFGTTPWAHWQLPCHPRVLRDLGRDPLSGWRCSSLLTGTGRVTKNSARSCWKFTGTPNATKRHPKSCLSTWCSTFCLLRTLRFLALSQWNQAPLQEVALVLGCEHDQRCSQLMSDTTEGFVGSSFVLRLVFPCGLFSMFCDVFLGMFFPSSFAKDSWRIFCSTISTILIQPEVFSEISWSCWSAGMLSAARAWIWNTVCHLLPPSCWAQALSLLCSPWNSSFFLLSCHLKDHTSRVSKTVSPAPHTPLSLFSSSLSSSPSSSLLYSKWPQQFLSCWNCRGT